MDRIASCRFVARYNEHCRKFRSEQKSIISALKGTCLDATPLSPPKIDDIIGRYGEDMRQGVVYLTAESWMLDTCGHRMVEPFMFSYYLEGNSIIFGM